MIDEARRIRAEAIVDSYIAKCDKVRPDGSSSEDIDNDLVEPIIALAAELVAAEQKRCAKICDEFLTIQDIKEGIEKGAL